MALAGHGTSMNLEDTDSCRSHNPAVSQPTTLLQACAGAALVALVGFGGCRTCRKTAAAPCLLSVPKAVAHTLRLQDGPHINGLRVQKPMPSLERLDSSSPSLLRYAAFDHVSIGHDTAVRSSSYCVPAERIDSPTRRLLPPLQPVVCPT